MKASSHEHVLGNRDKAPHILNFHRKPDATAFLVSFTPLFEEPIIEGKMSILLSVL
jgi:hypothetical protein